MRFVDTDLAGAVLIELVPHADERGFFARSFDEEEFARAGLPSRFPQQNLSRNARRHTLRGLHLEAPPSKESKLVRVARGAVFDVIVDLRPGSPTWGQWRGFDLDAEGGRALFIPPGFAHGFLTLADDTDVHYLMGDVYRPGFARSIRWDDPTLGVRWPAPPAVISVKDAEAPAFDPAAWPRSAP